MCVYMCVYNIFQIFKFYSIFFLQIFCFLFFFAYEAHWLMCLSLSLFVQFFKLITDDGDSAKNTFQANSKAFISSFKSNAGTTSTLAHVLPSCLMFYCCFCFQYAISIFFYCTSGPAYHIVVAYSNTVDDDVDDWWGLGAWYV